MNKPNMKWNKSTKTADTGKTIVASLFIDWEEPSGAKSELKCLPKRLPYLFRKISRTSISLSTLILLSTLTLRYIDS